MINYSNCSDEELLGIVSSGDRLAEEELAVRYSRLVKICARPYFLVGGDGEDLMQEGMLGLLSAIRDFDPLMGASFRAYAELCIKRRLYSAIKLASRLKHAPLNDGVSFDDILSMENIVPSAYGNEAFRRIPEEQVLDRESAEEFIRTYSQYLSKFETDILKLYLDGVSYAEMAAVLGRSLKSVDNAVQRLRRKLVSHPDLGEIS